MKLVDVFGGDVEELGHRQSVRGATPPDFGPFAEGALRGQLSVLHGYLDLDIDLDIRYRRLR